MTFIATVSVYCTYPHLVADEGRLARSVWYHQPEGDEGIRHALALSCRDRDAIALSVSVDGRTVATGHAPGGLGYI